MGATGKQLALAGLFLALACQISPAIAENPISSEFSADPSVHFFNGRFYLYATNDQGNSGKYWDSTDWRLYTSDDLAHWKDEGPFLKTSIFGWAAKDAKAWAPEAAFRNGKYYFYAPVGGKQIGVAVSDKPEGPFADALGHALVESPRDANAGDEPIDPAVLIDDDGQTYLYFGTRVPKAVKLKPDMIHTDGPILNVQINGFPTGDPKKKYGEAPDMLKHNGIYYFSFSSGWPGQILYTTSRDPLGPFDYQGVILDYLTISTNHHAVFEYKNRSYLFYHDNLLPGGGDFKRALAADEMYYTPDGHIVEVKETRAGLTPITSGSDKAR
jgi:beta-xylosidase